MADFPSRIPPHSLDAERAVLGAVLLEGRSALTRVASVLSPPSFYTEAHRTIFETMLGLAAERQPVDLITLTEALRRVGQLAFVGGAPALASLVEEAAIIAHLDSYAGIVLDHYVLRELIGTAVRLINQAFEGPDAQALLEEVEVRLRLLRVQTLGGADALAPRPLGQVLDAVVEELKAGPPVGLVRTPWPSLNNMLAGGYIPGELVYNGGYAGFGKTAMALEQTTFAAESGHAACVVSREMVVAALGKRVLSQHAHVTASALRAGNLSDSEWALITRVLPKLRGLSVWMTDKIVSIAQIEALVRAEKERHGLRLLVVDYLQLVRGMRGTPDKRLEVEHVSRTLKQLAVEYEIVVYCISAMSRRERTNANRRPTMGDLRETGALEHDADIILLGWRPKKDDPKCELIIEKGRGSKTGTIPLLFRSPILTFEEESDRPDPQGRQPGDERPEDALPW